MLYRTAYTPAASVTLADRYFAAALPAWFARSHLMLWYNVASKRHNVPCEHIYAWHYEGLRRAGA
jgi:hypothetical protein